ncbi:MAG: OmpA family protein [Ignavibacteria bacterium]|jgi:outer membrane protein OmpA-like peptidoglycan-associated protein|nr:OmpA family protein [Ignavibacteria bacterium]MCU7502210.1 OmpA family protein [Ignavibacteria bacterium]MCU7517427.1 OmpA family protein [Ignavibacteria bacterium]
MMILVFGGPLFAQEQRAFRRGHAFSGTLMFGVDGGVTMGITDYGKLKPDIMGRTALEYFFPSSSSGIFSIRAFGSGGYIKGRDVYRTPESFRTSFYSLGGGVAYNFAIINIVFPYIFAGASYMHFDPTDVNRNRLPRNALGQYNRYEVNYNGEIGLRTLLTDQISFNISAGVQFSPNDNWDDVIAKGNNDMMLQGMIGFSYSFFTKIDSDGDGVEDSKDMCPDTPAGVKVDQFGCPLDSDGDKVPDYQDKCPDTPKGVRVDKNGCPLDTDMDGVPDYADKCPNTPEGVQVDNSGCPLDTDGDGVADYMDKCPDTPKEARVDRNGCPLDGDMDGVPDYLDKCPNTPKGVQVDQNGCPIEKEKVTITKKIILSGDTNFESNKAQLLPAAYTQLNRLADVMKNNPETRWRIEGHTDSRGSSESNMKLSQRRAEAVADYLSSMGIERSRFEIIPYGSTRPIAPNNTSEGRAMNRRVEVRLIEE